MSQCVLTFPPNDLPVFNVLACDAGRCERCQCRRQEFYISSNTKYGAHLPNQFVCAECFPAAESETKARGAKMDIFIIEVDTPALLGFVDDSTEEVEQTAPEPAVLHSKSPGFAGPRGLYVGAEIKFYPYEGKPRKGKVTGLWPDRDYAEVSHGSNGHYSLDISRVELLNATVEHCAPIRTPLTRIDEAEAAAAI